MLEPLVRQDTGVPMSDETRRKLRRAAQMQAHWREERDELIRTARGEGATLQEIADLVGLSDTGVMKIIRK